VLQTLVKTVTRSTNITKSHYIMTWCRIYCHLPTMCSVTSSSNFQQISLATAQRSDCLSANTHPSTTFNALFGVRLPLTSSKQQAYQHKLDQSLIFDCSVIIRSLIFLNGFNLLSMFPVTDIFTSCPCVFSTRWWSKWMKEKCSKNNKLNVQKFRCCDCVDWIVSDWLTQRDCVAVIPGKLQPSSVQLINHECHCDIPNKQLLFGNGQKVRFYCYHLYCNSYYIIDYLYERYSYMWRGINTTIRKNT